MGRRFGHGFYGGPLGWYSHYKDYVYDMEHPYEVGMDGGERFDYENLPIYSSFWRYHSARQQASDSFLNTGIFDYYGNRYSGAFDSLVSNLSGAARFGKRMARNVEDMFDAEVQEDVSSSRRARRSRRYW